MIGRTLGRYRFEEKIGAGGMGEVYRAHDSHLERDVAVKILPTGTIRDDKARQRFRKEALALSRINHPNIATVHDFDTVDGIDFLVMELVPGSTLQEVIAGGPVDPGTVTGLASQLAGALEAAHKHGVVHRDLKPGNVKVTPDGHVKILDFGLAKLFRDTGETQEPVTDTNVQAGTLAYMSPEQVRGERVTVASDLFSFGTVLYELATGTHPFAADHDHSVAYKILNTAPEPPSKLRPEMGRFDGVVARLLEKEPGERYPSAGEAAGALTGDGTTPATHRRRPSRFMIGVSIGAVMALGVFMLMAFFRKPPDTLTVHSTGSIRQLTFTGGANIPVWSPDGKHIAYVEDGKPNLIPVEGGTPRVLETSYPYNITWGWMPDGSAVIGHAWNPDVNSWVCYKAGLYGEASQVLVESAMFPAVSPDLKTILFMSTDPDRAAQIWRQDMETGEQELLVAPPEEGTSTYKPKWSPDGELIAYIRWNGAGHELWVMTPDSTMDRRIDTGPIGVAGLYSWALDGRSFFIAGELHAIWSVWQIPYDGGPPPVRLTANPTMDCHVNLSPEGDRFAFGRSEDISRVAVIGVEDSTISYPVELSVATRNPVFSADGSSLYFQVLVNSRWQIWKAAIGDENTRARAVITNDDQSCFNVSTGAGAELLFVQGAYGRVTRWGRIGWSQTMWACNSDGGQKHQIEGAGDRVQRIAPRGFRGGRYIYSSNAPADYEVFYVLDSDGTSRQLFKDGTDGYCASMDWGRTDEEVILVHSDTLTAYRVDRVSAIGLETMDKQTLLVADSVFTEKPMNFSLGTTTRDGSRIALIVTGQDEKGLYVYDFKTKSLRRVYEFDPKTNPSHIAWSPDGTTVAVDLYKQSTDIFIWEPLSEQLANK